MKVTCVFAGLKQSLSLFFMLMMKRALPAEQVPHIYLKTLTQQLFTQLL